MSKLGRVTSIVLNNFQNDSRVLKENISLQNAGYKVRVVALHEEPLEEFETINDISVHRVKLKSKNWLKYKLAHPIKYFEFIYKISKEYKNSDIIHCNDLETMPIAFIIKKFYNKDIKVVYDAHEYETEMKNLRVLEKVGLKLMERFLIRYADSVITVSDTIANEYRRLYNIDKPAIVLNTPRYKEIEKKDIFRKKFNIEKEKSIFLYQGALNRGRGIEILLDTFKNIDNNRAVMLFMGYGELENLIKESSETHKNIYFHDAVPPDTILDYSSSADFGISTIEDICLSYRYCLPNKMFEYLMAEVPPIVSNLPEMRKIVEDNEVGVVIEENSPKGIENAIKIAVNINKENIKKNIREAKKLYNWENQEKVILEVYRKIGEEIQCQNQ